MNKIQIIIEFDPQSHQLNFKSNTQDGLLFMGMVEMAKNLFAAQQQKPAQNLITIPTLQPPQS